MLDYIALVKEKHELTYTKNFYVRLKWAKFIFNKE